MPELKFYFYKGLEEVLSKNKKSEEEEPDALKKIQDSFSKVLDGKNLSFLMGCGCTSFIINSIEAVPVVQTETTDTTPVPETETTDTTPIPEIETSEEIPVSDDQATESIPVSITITANPTTDSKTDIGVPTMVHLAKDFYANDLTTEDKTWLNENLNLDIQNKPFKNNLENFLGVLHSLHYFHESTGQIESETGIKVSKLITKTRNYLLKKCLNEVNRTSGEDKVLIDLYKSFYKKLLYRNSNLPKPNIFTTNYDLYSEIALDKLGIHYVNGFSGGIKKYFNPTIFNYALAEKMDLSQSKWSVIDNFVYLYKIHGSLNWIQDEEDTKLFRVRELQETTYSVLEKKEVIMIHPTPLKQNTSLGSPYSDLFREFQKKLMQNNNVLVTIGYSFSDEHINNLIYQAFTIPSFRLIIFGDKDSNDEIKKIQALDDPRIWIIGGLLENGEKLHHFKNFVQYILPDLSNDEIDTKIENAIRKLLGNNE